MLAELPETATGSMQVDMHKVERRLPHVDGYARVRDWLDPGRQVYGQEKKTYKGFAGKFSKDVI